MSDLVIVSDTRKQTTVELPSFPGSQVTILQELNMGSVRALNHISDPFDKAIEMMIMSIKDWNLAEQSADGSVVKMAITKENIDKFPQSDVMVLLAASQDTTPEELNARGQALALKKNTAV